MTAMYKPYSLTFVIRCEEKFYLGDDNPAQWGRLEAACLYNTEFQATERAGELSNGKRCETLCLIQDERFNFYDGRKFAYSMGEAKLYPADQAYLLAQRLNVENSAN
jgi:hypothetical protein